MDSSTSNPKSLLCRPREEADSPGQERKRFDSGSGSSDIIATMKSLLGEDRTKRDEQHQQLITTFNTLTSTVTGLQTSIENEKTIREGEIKAINDRLSAIEQKDPVNIEAVVKSAITKVMGTTRTSGTNDDTMGAERVRQVIVKGFDKDTDQDTIIATLEEFLATGTRRQKVVEVGSFTDPSSIGVITFETMAAKLGFFKKVRNHDTTLGNGRKLKFENNDVFKVRLCNQALMQVKYQLHQQLAHPLPDIKIDRSKGTVKIKKDLAATVSEDGAIDFETAAVQIKAEVEEHMAAWTAKRTNSDQ